MRGGWLDGMVLSELDRGGWREGKGWDEMKKVKWRWIGLDWAYSNELQGTDWWLAVAFCDADVLGICVCEGGGEGEGEEGAG